MISTQAAIRAVRGLLSANALDGTEMAGRREQIKKHLDDFLYHNLTFLHHYYMKGKRTTKARNC